MVCITVYCFCGRLPTYAPSTREKSRVAFPTREPQIDCAAMALVQPVNP